MKIKNINLCLICNSENLEQLFYNENFPLFFGAIPSDMKKDVKQYPLQISCCIKCGLVQQINLLEEEIMNQVYDADYYNCPSPVTTGMGLSEIEKFYSSILKQFGWVLSSENNNKDLVFIREEEILKINIKSINNNILITYNSFLSLNIN